INRNSGTDSTGETPAFVGPDAGTRREQKTKEHLYSAAAAHLYKRGNSRTGGSGLVRLWWWSHTRFAALLAGYVSERSATMGQHITCRSILCFDLVVFHPSLRPLMPLALCARRASDRSVVTALLATQTTWHG